MRSERWKYWSGRQFQRGQLVRRRRERKLVIFPRNPRENSQILDPQQSDRVLDAVQALQFGD